MSRTEPPDPGAEAAPVASSAVAQATVPGEAAPHLPPRGAAGKTPRSPAAGMGASPVPPAGLQAIAAKMSEDRGPDSLDAHVRRLMKDLGLMRYHTLRSLGSERGYPDWTICGPGGVLFRELKRQGKNPTAAQQQWLDALAAAGQDAGVWRPEDLLSGQVARELTAISGWNRGVA